MELDESSNGGHQKEQLLIQQQRSLTIDSFDTANNGFEKLRALTSSSEGDPASEFNTLHATSDFEDRIYATLRTSFYKQLRGCVKLFRKAALLCDKVLP